MSTREAILAAARNSVQARGYGGLNYGDLAADVGIKAASIYHHFPSKADLGAAVAKRYWEDTAVNLEAIAAKSPDPKTTLQKYPNTFRQSLERENRLCLHSFMSAEHDDLPEPVRNETQASADGNVAWLSKLLIAAGFVGSAVSEDHARAIFAAIAGAQLMASSRSDITLFDTLIKSYRDAGLLPT